MNKQEQGKINPLAFYNGYGPMRGKMFAARLAEVNGETVIAAFDNEGCPVDIEINPRYADLIAQCYRIPELESRIRELELEK